MAVAIPLTRGLVALVDESDAEAVLAHRWYARPARLTIYAVRSAADPSRPQRRRAVILHRVLLGATEGQFVDHVDGDGLNNQRSNLRLCSHIENARNRARNRSSSWHFKGVERRPSGSWRARIGGKCQLVGTFASEIEAARAYDVAALALYGEFARLNFPLEAK